MIFDSTFFGQPSVSMNDLKTWAADISSRYLCDKDDPTQSLIKVAQDRSLTPHQIEVLAGEINRCIHTAKYASVEDKYHAADFPLASAKEAVQSLQVGGEKVASEAESIFADPIVKSFDAYVAFGVQEETMDKTAEEKIAMRKEAQKAKLLASMQEDVEYLAKTATVNAEASFIKEARTYILGGMNQKERMSKLATVAHVARDSGLYNQAAKPLAKIAYSLGTEGLLDPTITKNVMDYFMEKKADVTAPEGLISEFLPARVVNGTHPLVITLKTYADAEEREAIEAKRRGLIDDKARIYAQKIRAL